MVEALQREQRPLLLRDIPPVSAELQRNLLINPLKTLRVRTVGMFDPEKAMETIARQEGKLVTAFDIGGDKIARQVFQIKSGELAPVTGIDIQKGTHGDTYLPFLEASRQTPFVGISCAGLLDGTILEDSPNARIFTAQLKERYEGDFKRLFYTSRVALDNDAIAGVRVAAIEAYKRNPLVRNIFFAINGGGFGIATLTFDSRTKQWRLVASEPGHIKAPRDLNPFHRKEACGMGGATYTCIEKIVASGAGIEGTFFQVTGRKQDGHQIGDSYEYGDAFATRLYDLSAIGLAQVLYLEEKILGFKPNETAIVYHGGAFKARDYAERVTQVMEKYVGSPQMTFKSTDFAQNAGLTGVAVASLVRE